MTDISYNKLFEAVAASLPENWCSVKIIASFKGESCDIRYEAMCADGTWRDCFSLSRDKYQLFQTLTTLHEEIAYSRNQLSGADKWNAATVMIEADGNFRSDFDYSEQKEEGKDNG